MQSKGSKLTLASTMFTSDVIAFYGTVQKVAEAAGVTSRAVRLWKELVPPLSAIKLERASGGKLSIDIDLYETWNNRKVG